MHFTLQTKSQKEEYLSMIKKGHLDIIVGTHALLGNRVVYSNLGLLVVDEEQVVSSIVKYCICQITLTVELNNQFSKILCEPHNKLMYLRTICSSSV